MHGGRQFLSDDVAQRVDPGPPGPPAGAGVAAGYRAPGPRQPPASGAQPGGRAGPPPARATHALAWLVLARRRRRRSLHAHGHRLLLRSLRYPARPCRGVSRTAAPSLRGAEDGGPGAVCSLWQGLRRPVAAGRRHVLGTGPRCRHGPGGASGGRRGGHAAGRDGPIGVLCAAHRAPSGGFALSRSLAGGAKVAFPRALRSWGWNRKRVAASLPRLFRRTAARQVVEMIGGLP